jgi:hypothetical protein
LYHALSPEAYHFVHDAFGYESIVSNWNAAEALPWFLADFDTPAYKTVAAGLEDAVLRLFARAYAAGRSTSELPYWGHVLLAIRPDGVGGGFRLDFETRDAEPVRIGRKELRAREVVLAFGKRALEKVHMFEGASWEKRCRKEGRSGHEIRAALSRVSEHPLFKLFIIYDQPCWPVPKVAEDELQEWSGKEGIAGWRAVTDLPIRQVYHFTARDEHGRMRGIVMASYSDEHYVDFWRPLGKRETGEEVADDEICRPSGRCSEEEEKYIKQFGARLDLVAKAEKQLRQLHGEFGATRQVAYCKDWGDEFTYAGWHTWNSRVDVLDTVKLLASPCSGLYVCGEAFSTQQGWVEGALKSAELVLGRMGAGVPGWLTLASRAEVESYASA